MVPDEVFEVELLELPELLALCDAVLVPERLLDALLWVLVPGLLEPVALLELVPIPGLVCEVAVWSETEEDKIELVMDVESKAAPVLLVSPLGEVDPPGACSAVAPEAVDPGMPPVPTETEGSSKTSDAELPPHAVRLTSAQSPMATSEPVGPGRT